VSGRKQSLSIFSYPADRGTFVAYFLGAVVPLVVLGIMADRFVLAPMGAAPDTRYPVALGAGALVGLLL
jgi:hypothetical protein